MDRLTQSIKAPPTWRDNPELSGKSLLRFEEVSEIVKMKRTAVYSGVRAGTFPAPKRISARCSRWSTAEIVAWLNAHEVTA